MLTQAGLVCIKVATGLRIQITVYTFQSGRDEILPICAEFGLMTRVHLTDASRMFSKAGQHTRYYLLLGAGVQRFTLRSNQLYVAIRLDWTALFVDSAYNYSSVSLCSRSFLIP